MTDTPERNAWTARSALSGMVPTRAATGPVRTGVAVSTDPLAVEPPAERSRLAKSLFATMPIVLVGSMAVAMNLTGPIEPTQPKRTLKPRTMTSELGKTIRDALSAANAAVKLAATGPIPAISATAAAPSTYKVVAGDTVSSIAGRFGLSTASVLAMNGLGWKSVIFPGQVLKLGSGAAAPAPVAPPASTVSSRYTIVGGDTISKVASKFGVSTQAVLTANGLSWSSIIYPGQTLAIPGLALASNVTPAPVAAPVSEPTTPVVSAPTTTYTIVAGDTISKIAAKFGLTAQSILTANGLAWNSVIYAGRPLTLPSTAIAPAATGVTGLTAEMAANARIIVSVGRSLGVSDYGIVIALATAMQESSMRNINYGDRDSLGLFQQRPSAGWGTPEQLLNATHAARLFYGGPSGPNAGKTRGLLDIAGWQSMAVTQAAQKVQISAFPNAYAKWESSARAWLASIG